jgi:hypothetical protein
MVSGWYAVLFQEAAFQNFDKHGVGMRTAEPHVSVVVEILTLDLLASG